MGRIVAAVVLLALGVAIAALIPSRYYCLPSLGGARLQPVSSLSEEVLGNEPSDGVPPYLCATSDVADVTVPWQYAYEDARVPLRLGTVALGALIAVMLVARGGRTTKRAYKGESAPDSIDRQR